MSKIILGFDSFKNLAAIQILSSPNLKEIIKKRLDQEMKKYWYKN